MKTITYKGKQVEQLTMKDLELFTEKELAGIKRKLVIRLFAHTNRYARQAASKNVPFDIKGGLGFIQRYTLMSGQESKH
jgi:hypothetical protein